MMNLARALSARFRQNGQTQDLEDAIQLYRDSLEICSVGYPNRADMLMDLASALYTRFQKTNQGKDMEEALWLLETSAGNKMSSSLARLEAATRWARNT